MGDQTSAEQLIHSTIKMVAKDGLIGLTTKKIAKHSGMSEGMIYVHFKGKTDLLEACFFHVDKRFAASFEKLELMSLSAVPPEEEVYELWSLFFRMLLAIPEELIFYRRFLDSTYYTTQVAEKRKEYFGAFIKIVMTIIKRYDVYDQCPSDMIWEYLLNTTYSFAEQVIRGKYQADDKTVRQIFDLIYSGIGGLLKK